MPSRFHWSPGLTFLTVGHNINDGSLKEKILVGVQSLRKGDGQIAPRVYRQ